MVSTSHATGTVGVWRLPRVVVAAPASGHGKTSVTTGLLGAFAGRGLAVSPHKVGPDYIDPGYHALASGRVGRNLDPWLVGEERIVPLFLHGALNPTRADIAIVEGVMGLFDGVSGSRGFASTAHVARLLQAPVILIVDASAQARSVAALVHGFASFDPTVQLAGVILNRVGSDLHEHALREAVDEVGLPVFGAIRRDDALVTPSRHLGLVPAAERSADAQATVARLAEKVGAAIDLDAVFLAAQRAPALTAAPWDPAMEAAGATAHGARPLVCIAGGAAFTFGYAETVELLRAAGADVAILDPLCDEALPEPVAGLVIGGGFPEVHADALSANEPLRVDVARFARSGAPVVAECAGLLYLAKSLDGQPMCGVLPVDSTMSDRLRLGYRDAVAPGDSVVAAAGARVRGHEFHRTVCTPSAGCVPAWRWAPDVSDGFVQRGVHASYLHLNWAGHPYIADQFVQAAAGRR